MKRHLASPLAVVFILFATACTDRSSADIPADTVFVDGKVCTLDDSMPWAAAVAVRGDTIVYVGDTEGAEALTGEDTRRVDLGGQLMLPGFIDTHVHPVAGGAYAQALSLDTFGTIDEWVQAIADYAAANPDDEVLFGYGFLATTFGPVGPTRQLIDAIVPDRPVLIMDEGFHAAWANTATLERLNITQGTPDPVPGYSYYKRDANGDATGYLLEGTAGMAMDALDVITADVVAEGTGIVIDIMNSYGVTAAFDAGTMGDIEVVKYALSNLEKHGELTVRIVGSSRPGTAEEAATAVDVAEQWASAVRGDRYHYNTLKIPDDGTVEGRTAAMFEDYQGEPGNSGETVFTEEQLTAMISDAAARNIDVHVHALGERAVHETLNAIEHAQRANPESPTRYTICHVQVVTDQDAPVQPRESERLSVESLVRGFTTNAAYQLRMEDSIGSIEVGKQADLVVLDRNIFKIDPYSIHNTVVVMTIMDGDIVHEQGAADE